jgi:polyhydroxybutyrate depolymerase
VTVSGQQRQYWLSLPKNYDTNKPYPLVFAFHGSGDTGQDFSTWLGVEDNSPGQAIFIYPDGVDGIWDLQNSGSDFTMIDQIVQSLDTGYCVNQAATFTIGFSYGGWAATQLACARPDLVKGMISIAGGGPRGSCKNVTASMIVHGTADTSEPIASGRSTRDKAITNNGCTQTSHAGSPSPCVEYEGCQERVLWCEHPGEHEIPEFVQTSAWSFFASVI